MDNSSRCCLPYAKGEDRLYPTLTAVHPSRTAYVTTDWSVKGAGAVLSQADASGKECVVAFWSRRLYPCEQMYSINEREALSAVNAVEK